MKQAFTHVLQKTGILKTFTVAKVVNKKDVEELKALIKTVASDENEYKQLLEEELKKLSNMHDNKNPIPGIIYSDSDSDKQQIMFAIAKKFHQGVEQYNFTKTEMAFLITAILNELELSQDDFESLREELDEYDEDGEDGVDEEYEE